MIENEVKVIRLPVSAKIEDAAKGEIRVTVNIDGEDEGEVADRIIKFYRAVKAETEKEG